MGKAERIARERSWRNRYSSTHLGILGDPDRIDQDGVVGEMAFAEMFGIAVTEVKRKRPVSHNFTLHDGTRVDVRASRARNPKLIVPPRIAKRASIDVFVLAEVVDGGKRAILRGWATRQEVREAPVKKISSLPDAEPVHVLYEWDLHEMEDLKMRHIPTMRPMFDLDAI